MRLLPRIVAAAALSALSMVSTIVVVPVAEARAAAGCLPTNGLMNLNPAADIMAGNVVLHSGVTVDIGTGNVNWSRPGLDAQSALQLYSLKWVEELVRESTRSGDKRYLNRATEIVLDFAADHPIGGGPDPANAWYPMYAGQRTTTIACVASDSGHSGVDAALRSHGQWLSNLAPDLDSWNQAIDPLLGLSMAGCDLGVREWRDQASGGFAGLITAMIDADGVLLEQSPGYGRFVWERWGVVTDQLASCDQPVPAEVTQRRAALLEWLAWMSAPDGTTTPLGDTFRGTPPPTPSGSPTAYTVPGGTTGRPPAGNVRVFDGGYVAGRSSWADLQRSTYGTLRFGPGRDFHGHEDHTGVTLWIEGREVLADSGHTGYGNSARREALRSPEAHNVLMLPDIDFRLRQPTELVRSAVGTGWRFDEVRDHAYELQNGRIVFAPRTRGVLMLPDDGVMVVRDHATRTTHGPFEQLWHLVPGAQVVSVTDRGVVARHPAGDVDVHVLQVPLPGQQVPAATSVVEGQQDPLLGWVADYDGDFRPAPVVRMRRTGTDETMVTVVTTTSVGGSASARASKVAGGWTVDVERNNTRRLIGIANDGAMLLGPPAEPVAAGGRWCFGVAGSPGDAAIVNVTPVEASGPGFGVVLSSDADGSESSNVNFGPGSVDPNVAVVPIGADGEVCYVNSPLASVHVVADHLGTISASAYRMASSSGEPVRKVDTRVGGKPVAAGGRWCFGVAGSPGDAAIVNVTPVEASGPGFGVVLSSDADGSESSNVNFGPGSVDPNVAVVPIGADGEVCYVNSPLASVHVVADHLGTISASAYRMASSSGEPVRKVDTRVGGKPVAAGGRWCFGVAGSPGDAAIVNVTPVEASGPGFGVVLSSDADGSESSNVNFGPGSVDPNVAVVPIGADGEVCYVNSPLASVHVVADHLGTISASAYRMASSSGEPVRKVDTRL